jgi:hypothetical protein
MCRQQYSRSTLAHEYVLSMLSSANLANTNGSSAEQAGLSMMMMIDDECGFVV